jgi:hypothetical protein
MEVPELKAATTALLSSKLLLRISV